MDSFDEIYNRIIEITQAKTQTDLAEIFDTSQSSISEAKKRRTIPATWTLKLVKLYNVNPEWLMFDKEPKFLRNDEPELNFKPTSFSMMSEKNDRQMPIYSCNYTHISYEKNKLEIVDSFTMPQHFTKYCNKKNFLAFRLDNRSMEPILHHGAILGVDSSQLNLQSGEIFAFFIEGEGLKFKRLLYDGVKDNYLLVAENQNTHNIIYKPKNKSIFVIGKLIWVMQEF